MRYLNYFFQSKLLWEEEQQKMKRKDLKEEREAVKEADRIFEIAKRDLDIKAVIDLEGNLICRENKTTLMSFYIFLYCIYA